MSYTFVHFSQGPGITPCAHTHIHEHTVLYILCTCGIHTWYTHANHTPQCMCCTHTCSICKQHTCTVYTWYTHMHMIHTWYIYMAHTHIRYTCTHITPVLSALHHTHDNLAPRPLAPNADSQPLVLLALLAHISWRQDTVGQRQEEEARASPPCSPAPSCTSTVDVHSVAVCFLQAQRAGKEASGAVRLLPREGQGLGGTHQQPT